jgi:hypothetical protein
MRKFLVTSALALLAIATGKAGVEQPAERLLTQESDSVFNKGAKEFQNVTGVNYFIDRSSDRPSVDYALDSVRFGIMLCNPNGSNFLAGNFEFLTDIFAGPIFQGPGDVVVGSTMFLRYNFVQPRARIIPYLQIGAGLIYTDVSEKESRGLVSLPVEFNLQGALGLRFMVNQRWSIVAEGEYRHISNAEIHKPNFGINTVGGNLGFGLFF